MTAKGMKSSPFWDDISVRWDDHFFHRHCEGHMNGLLDLAISISPDKLIIDVGAGDGDFTEKLRQQNCWKIVPVDYSPKMVDKMRNRFDDKNITPTVADAGDLQSVVHGVVGGAFANFSIIFMPNPLEGIRSMSQVVSPQGGVIGFTSWSRLESNPLITTIYESLNKAGMHPPGSPFPAPALENFSLPSSEKCLHALDSTQIQFSSVSSKEYFFPDPLCDDELIDNIVRSFCPKKENPILRESLTQAIPLLGEDERGTRAMLTTAVRMA